MYRGSRLSQLATDTFITLQTGAMAGDDWISTSPIALSQPLRAREFTPGRTLTKLEVREQRRRGYATETSKRATFCRTKHVQELTQALSCSFQSLGFTQKSLFDADPVASTSDMHDMQRQHQYHLEEVRDGSHISARPDTVKSPAKSKRGLTPRDAGIAISKLARPIVDDEQAVQVYSSPKGKDRAAQDDDHPQEPLFQPSSPEIPVPEEVSRKSKKRRITESALDEDSALPEADQPEPMLSPLLVPSPAKQKQPIHAPVTATDAIVKKKKKKQAALTEEDPVDQARPKKANGTDSKAKLSDSPKASMAKTVRGGTKTKEIAEDSGNSEESLSKKSNEKAGAVGKQKAVTKRMKASMSFAEVFDGSRKRVLEVLRGDGYVTTWGRFASAEVSKFRVGSDGEGDGGKRKLASLVEEKAQAKVKRPDSAQTYAATNPPSQSEQRRLFQETKQRRQDTERQTVESETRRRALADEMLQEEAGWRKSRQQLQIEAGLHTSSMRLYYGYIESPEDFVSALVLLW